jgi:hypothetical protein
MQLWHNLGWSDSENQTYIRDSVGITKYDRYGANNELKTIYTDGNIGSYSLAHKNLSMYFPMIYPDYHYDTWAALRKNPGTGLATFPMWIQDTGSVSENFGVSSNVGNSENDSYRTVIIVGFSILCIVILALIILRIFSDRAQSVKPTSLVAAQPTNSAINKI